MPASEPAVGGRRVQGEHASVTVVDGHDGGRRRLGVVEEIADLRRDRVGPIKLRG